jgi:hypothetical protein
MRSVVSISLAVAIVGWLAILLAKLWEPRSSALVVQLNSAGEVMGCWSITMCDVDIQGDSGVTWQCGYLARRHVSPPFRVSEREIDYDVLGLKWNDERCVKEDGRR